MRTNEAVSVILLIIVKAFEIRSGTVAAQYIGEAAIPTQKHPIQDKYSH